MEEEITVGEAELDQWRFGAANPAMEAARSQSIRAIVHRMYRCLDGGDPRPVAPLAHGDPSAFACFRAAPAAVHAIAAAATSGKYNFYSVATGIAEGCRAVAAHLSRELPYEVSAADVVLTAGCNHAVEIMMSVLASPGANVLLPRPGYPLYASRAALSGLEFRYFDLLPDREWEVDLAAVEALADRNTVAIVIVNPNNPCGCVYSRQHLSQIAETARKLGIMVINDEVYDHFAFGSKPFVPMGVFGGIAPVMTLGGISKRWMVPGWRLGWIAATDPNGILRKKKIMESIIDYRAISVDPVTFVQAALPEILANTDEAFFANALSVVREAAEICYEKLKEIECITCPHKPEGSMFVMAKLDLSFLDGIEDDIDFCSKLAKEESVVICPGSGLGMKNWLRITFAVDPKLLEDGLERTKSFCHRHRWLYPQIGELLRGEATGAPRWRFTRACEDGPLASAGPRSIRAVLNRVIASVDAAGPRPVLPLGNGDPTASACFRTAIEAEDAVVDALRSGAYNGYSLTVGILAARRGVFLICIFGNLSAIAEYLSRDLPYELSADDIYLTSGCVQAIEVMISVLAQPGSNILLPRPGFPFYESRTTFSNLEARYFNLIPERGWEVDLEGVQAIADENTVAIVVVNPSNPCGSVYSYDHLAKIAETARKLGLMIIADEVYDHLAFGNKPFIPMGVFGETVPVITLGSISKRWLVPGWRLGWIATCDPNGILKEAKVNQSIENYSNISTDPATFVQGAIPQIIANTKEDYFNKILDLLRNTADLCYDKIKYIRGITCPHKPEGAMFAMVKLDLCYLDGLHDDIEFCCMLAKEESVIVLPGSALGMKNWIRITFAIDIPSLEDALERIKSFCQRHRKLEA
uniref:nicotianamine aminotransferase n=1 Tax=Leersia perrieri TaxID=77586 RepID=A0A0D9VF58_9ORYZ